MAMVGFSGSAFKGGVEVVDDAGNLCGFGDFYRTSLARLFITCTKSSTKCPGLGDIFSAVAQ